jgi:integrase
MAQVGGTLLPGRKDFKPPAERDGRGSPPRLLDEVPSRRGRLGSALRTETVDAYWTRRYVLANRKRHPRDMGAAEVEWFLTRLAVEGEVSASTQNQALAALLFLYCEVRGIDLPWMSNIRRAKRPERLPNVLSRPEVKALLAQLDGTVGSMVRLLYGSGLRLMECLRLRVQDIRSQRKEVLPAWQGRQRPGDDAAASAGGADQEADHPRSAVA